MLEDLREAASSSDVSGQPMDCEVGCAHAARGPHTHTRFEIEDRDTELTVQTFHWGADVAARNSLVVAWWVLRAALAVMLLQLVSPWGVTQRRSRWLVNAYRRYPRRTVWAAIVLTPLLSAAVFFATFVLIGWLIWLVVRAGAYLAAGVLGFLIVPVYGGVVWLIGRVCPGAAARMSTPILLINDALTWCSDADFRRWVVAECDDRIRAADADHTVLIGHSQGGSILTEWSREADLERRSRTTLVTLGSGQGILATLHEALKGWRIVQSVVASATVLAFVAAALFLIWAFLSSVGGTLALLRSTAVLLQAAWLGDLLLDEYVTASAEASAVDARASLSAAIAQLTNESSPPALVVVAGLTFTVATLMLFAIVLAVITPLARVIMARCVTEVDGMDLSATRDPISKPLHVLGEAARLQRIPQSGSVFLDHVRYWNNRISVWPAVAGAVSHAIVGVRFDARARVRWNQTFGPAASEHRTELQALSVIRGVTGFLAVTPLLALMTPGFDDVATSMTYLAAAITCWWAATVRGLHLLQRNSALVADGTMRDLAERRSVRRSIPRAAAVIILALPLLGVLTMPADLEGIVEPMSIGIVETAAKFALPAIFLLLLTALSFWRGSLIARPLAVTSVTFTAISWLTLGSNGGIWFVVTVILGALVTFTRSPRHRMDHPYHWNRWRRASTPI